MTTKIVVPGLVIKIALPATSW